MIRFSLPLAAVIVAFLLAPGLARAQAGARAEAAQAPGQPLIVRGYTDAPAGTARVGAAAPGFVVDLRVKDGQQVKAGDIVAVMSPHDSYAKHLKILEVRRQLVLKRIDSLRDGPRTADISMFEKTVRGIELSNQLAQIERQSSAKRPEVKQLELEIAQNALEREQQRLATMRVVLDADRGLVNGELAMVDAEIEHLKSQLDGSIVRTPIDGVVVQIFARPGESVAGQGVAKIIDLGQMRVLADVDEVNLDRVRIGGAAEVALRGRNDIYKGRVVRIVPSVNRMRRADPDGGTPMDARVVQVEVELDDARGLPRVIGREVRVTLR